ncbi:SRPBCC family protein [Henriciella marina]|uniref:SRPBCC family protein n=1 Tax=Henriciella marina TaxID=453851 RepID=UPI00035C604F|nr:SRPBCC family protein [Henriciella marina]
MADRIEKSVSLKSSIEQVWDAITDHRKFGEWFRVDLHQPFVEGQTSHGQMTYPGYEHFKWESRTIAIVPKSYFSFVWYHDNLETGPDTPRLETLVEFKLRPDGNGTQLTIIESGFDDFPPEVGKVALESNTGGWEEQISNIRKFVDG